MPGINIPTLVIGSTIVAFGTSMPEFTVNINSALNGNTDLALGRLMGGLLVAIYVGYIGYSLMSLSLLVTK